MEIGQLQQFSSSSSILWTDGNDPVTGEAYYQFNRGTPINITSASGDGPQEGDITSSSSSYVSNLASTTHYEKNENGSSINTQKSLEAQDSIGASYSGEQSASATLVLTGDSEHGGTYTSESAGLVRNTENTGDVQ